jgi:Domain of unknown function (DUF5664)
MQNDKVSSGAVKKDEGKLRFDLIPVEPLRRVAEVYTIGAGKYSDRNWERGLQWGRVYAALQRHANAWWGGEGYDKVDGQHHLASVVWCALALMEYENTHPELDDRKTTTVINIEPYIHPKVKSMVYEINDPGNKYLYDKYKQGTDPTEDCICNSSIQGRCKAHDNKGQHGGV